MYVYSDLDYLTVDTSCHTRYSTGRYWERFEFRQKPQVPESIVIAFSHLRDCRVPILKVKFGIYHE